MIRRRTPSVTAYENGPFLVRGPVEIVREDGTLVQTHRSAIALCRCGRSAIRPLCDGSHAGTPRRSESR
jgi:CDGSH-type Zn-finger protein